MPFLSPNLQSAISVREALLNALRWAKLCKTLGGCAKEIDTLRSQLRLRIWEWQVGTLLAEMYGTYRKDHPRNEALYDVFTELVRPDNNIMRIINNNRLETDNLNLILEHYFNLLRDAGLVTESGSISSTVNDNDSEFNSENNESSSENNESSSE